MARRIGLIVNPVAGMGGAVGLKGTDAKVDEAVKRGAKPRAHPRAVEFLRHLPTDATLLTCAGAMGEDACAEADVSALVVYTPDEPSSAEDTRRAARALAEAGVDLIAFVGGDGTAADVAAGLGRTRRRGADAAAAALSAADVAAGVMDSSTPALGIPAGVKMYSPVFADNPEVAGVIVATFDDTQLQEVLDIDEDAYRRDELRVALKGALLVPTHARVQGSKMADDDDEVEAASLAQAVVETLEPGHTYVLGAGTTMQHVKDALGIDGTLLGLDVVWLDEEGKAHLLVKDASERDLLELRVGVEVVVSPIGHQGFFLGRGNLPLTPAVLSRLALPGDVRVVATPWKLLQTPALKVDTGDAALDARFPRFLPVVTGHGQTKLMRVA